MFENKTKGWKLLKKIIKLSVTPYSININILNALKYFSLGSNYFKGFFVTCTKSLYLNIPNTDMIAIMKIS